MKWIGDADGNLVAGDLGVGNGRGARRGAGSRSRAARRLLVATLPI